MKKISSLVLVLCFVLICFFTNGCATMINGRTQQISIKTNSENTINATVENDKFITNVVLPASIAVMRSSDNIKVTLNDKCYRVLRIENAAGEDTQPLADNEFIIPSFYSAVNLLNVAFLGLATVVGGATDIASSAAWSYDDLTTIPVKNICEDNQYKPDQQASSSNTTQNASDVPEYNVITQQYTDWHVTRKPETRTNQGHIIASTQNNNGDVLSLAFWHEKGTPNFRIVISKGSPYVSRANKERVTISADNVFFSNTMVEITTSGNGRTRFSLLGIKYEDMFKRFNLGKTVRFEIASIPTPLVMEFSLLGFEEALQYMSEQAINMSGSP